MAPAAQLKRQF